MRGGGNQEGIGSMGQVEGISNKVANNKWNGRKEGGREVRVLEGEEQQVQNE